MNDNGREGGVGCAIPLGNCAFFAIERLMLFRIEPAKVEALEEQKPRLDRLFARI